MNSRSKHGHRNKFFMLLFLLCFFISGTVGLSYLIYNRLRDNRENAQSRFVPQSDSDVNKLLLRSSVAIFSSDGKSGGIGSGVLISISNRMVLTNFHVVDNRPECRVLFPAYDKNGEVISDFNYYDGRMKQLAIKGKVIRHDRKADLAIIQLENVPSDALEIAISHAPASTGHSVHNLGSSGLAHEQILWRYSHGKVRLRARKVQLFANQTINAMILETDAPFNPGDSGGAVVNDRCELIGIVSSMNTKERNISNNIDLDEVKQFLGDDLPIQNVATSSAGSGTASNRQGPMGSPQIVVTPTPEVPLTPEAQIAQLKMDSKPKRLVAIRNLAGLKEESRPAIPALLDLLDGKDADIESAVELALTAIGPPLEAQATAVEKSIESRSPVARKYALESYTKSLIANERALGQLGKLTTDPNEGVRLQVVSAITRASRVSRSRVISELFPALSDTSKAVSAAALTGLKSLEPFTANDRPELEKQFSGEDPVRRKYAAQQLMTFTTNETEAEKLLPKLARDRQLEIRLMGFQGLAKWPGVSRASIIEIQSGLNDPEEPIRLAAIAVTRHIPHSDVVKQKLLLLARNDSSETVRNNAWGVVQGMLTSTESDGSTFRELVQSQSAEIRKYAILQLGKGQPKSDIVQIVTDKVSDPDASVARTALQTLTQWKHSHTSAVAKAVTFIGDASDREAKSEQIELAVEAINYLTATGEVGQQKLFDAVRRIESPPLVAAACESFATMKKPSPEILGWLYAKAESGSRIIAVKTLARIATDDVATAVMKRADFNLVQQGKSLVPANPVETRAWAISCMGQMDLSKMSEMMKKRVIEKLKFCAQYEKNADNAAAASIALRNQGISR